jgi:uncharacterized metal-binding protein
MAKDCCAANGNIMILACSGGSNVGQLSNRAAVELTQEGFGKMFCLVGIGGHLGGFVQSAKDVPMMVAVDGCSVGCARAILAQAEVPSKNYLVVTDLGIEKNKDFNLQNEDVAKVKLAIRAVCSKQSVEKETAATESAGCCG